MARKLFAGILVVAFVVIFSASAFAVVNVYEKAPDAYGASDWGWDMFASLALVWEELLSLQIISAIFDFAKLVGIDLTLGLLVLLVKLCTFGFLDLWWLYVYVSGFFEIIFGGIGGFLQWILNLVFKIIFFLF